jgi:hypothetical protein
VEVTGAFSGRGAAQFDAAAMGARNCKNPFTTFEL